MKNVISGGKYISYYCTPNLMAFEHLVLHPTVRNYTHILVGLLFKQGIFL